MKSASEPTANPPDMDAADTDTVVEELRNRALDGVDTQQHTPFNDASIFVFMAPLSLVACGWLLSDVSDDMVRISFAHCADKRSVVTCEVAFEISTSVTLVVFFGRCTLRHS